MSAPRVDRVDATYFRSGKCVECSGSAERTRTFTAATMGECERLAEAWMQTPLRHKRCEGRAR